MYVKPSSQLMKWMKDSVVIESALIHTPNMFHRSSITLVIIENVSWNSGKSVGAC